VVFSYLILLFGVVATKIVIKIIFILTYLQYIQNLTQNNFKPWQMHYNAKPDIVAILLPLQEQEASLYLSWNCCYTNLFASPPD